jgi:GxxExxY protein
MIDQSLRVIMEQIIDELGYGLRESVYQSALAVELRFQGHKVELEVNKSVLYRGHNVGTVRLDMVIDDNYIVEFKALAKITKKEIAQLQQYMKISSIKNGTIINVTTDNMVVL